MGRDKDLSAAEVLNKVKHLEMEVAGLRNKLTKTSLLLQAMWRLASDKLQLSDDELNRLVMALEEADRLEAKAAELCPGCGRALQKNSVLCIYCGSKVEKRSLF